MFWLLVDGMMLLNDILPISTGPLRLFDSTMRVGIWRKRSWIWTKCSLQPSVKIVGLDKPWRGKACRTDVAWSPIWCLISQSIGNPETPQFFTTLILSFCFVSRKFYFFHFIHFGNDRVHTVFDAGERFSIRLSSECCCVCRYMSYSTFDYYCT